MQEQKGMLNAKLGEEIARMQVGYVCSLTLEDRAVRFSVRSVYVGLLFVEDIKPYSHLFRHR